MYPQNLLSAEGRYGCAIARLRVKRLPLTDKKINQLVFRLVHECEEARRWIEQGQDYPTALDERHDVRREVCAEAYPLVRKLTQLAKREPYFFRHCLKAALTKQVGGHEDLNVALPDANQPDGEVRHTASARTWLYTDHLLCWRIGLFQCDEFLEDWTSELAEVNDLSRNVRQLGCLRFEPALSRKAASKVRVEVAGLSAWLSFHLRNASQGRAVTATWPGQAMPYDGKPCWELVSDFINAAFPDTQPVSATSLRSQWKTLSRARKVLIDPWPREAICEPQVAN